MGYGASERERQESEEAQNGRMEIKREKPQEREEREKKRGNGKFPGEESEKRGHGSQYEDDGRRRKREGLVRRERTQENEGANWGNRKIEREREIARLKLKETRE